MNEITKNQLFQRQTTMSEFGDLGQQKLQDSSIVIVGCGGLGNTAAVFLATSGIGRIHLIDFDTVDVSNLHRQVFFKTDQIGQPKAEVLAQYIQNVAPFTDVTFSNEALSKTNVFNSIKDFDIVMDCTDNLPIKYLINDACVLNDKILVYGSLYKFDGYVASFNVLDTEGNRTANLRDAFPEIPKNNIPNCSEAGTLNTIVGIIGLMQANEVINIVAEIGSPLVNQLQIYNSLDSSQYQMKLKRLQTKESIQLIFEKENYSNFEPDIQNKELLISAFSLKNKIKNKDNFKIISVIENINSDLPFDVDLKIPLSQLNPEKIDFKRNVDYILVCNKGISSYIALQRIKEIHQDLHVLSLENGINNY